jgi:oxygen-independent coproporphyrinogen-3 oxidase
VNANPPDQSEIAPALGIYLQIPFCASKCSFCNFSSRVSPAGVFDGYCLAVESEIHGLGSFYARNGIGSRILEFAVDTLYIGGGTPPLVGSERLSRMMTALRGRLRTDHLDEFTMEVTPGSASQQVLRDLRGLGVNRLSVGAQSFNDRELSAVGRLHTAAETCEMIAAVRREGFDNFSIDLIAGLPHQTADSWRATLETLARVQPGHASVYIFEVDEKSRLGGEVIRHGTRYHALAVPDEDFVADAYERARSFLRAEGYCQYEISNFALPGRESRHNRKYWRREPYVGLGAGAHSFDGERRWANEVSPAKYQARLEARLSPIEQCSTLSQDEQLAEFFFLGLRQAEGVDLSLARKLWGPEPVGRTESVLGVLSERGLIERDGDRIRLSDSAYLVSNEVFQEFLAAREEV